MSVNHPLDDYIQNKINQALNNYEMELKEKDAKMIVSTILPEIDKLISKKVKMHIQFLAEYILKSIKEENSGDAKNP